MSLARRLEDAGRGAEAREILLPILDGIGDALDLPDVHLARRLIDASGGTTAR